MVSEKHDTNTWRLIQIQVPLFVCYFLYVLPVILSSTVIGEGIDLFGTLWFYWWVDFVPEVGSEDTPMFFYPYGKDFFAHTGNNLVDAYLSIPFQKIFGLPNYQPFFVLFLFLLNSIALQRLFFLFNQQKLVIAFGIIMTLFSPYFMWEISCGRLTQFVIFPAILSLEAMERCRRSPSFIRAIAAGGFAALQGWTYWFYGYFLGFFLLFYTLIYNREFRKTNQISYLVTALGTCMVGIAPAVASMVSKFQQGQIPGLDQKPVYELLFAYTPWEPIGIPFFSFVSVFASLLLISFTKNKILLWGWVLLSLCITCGGRGQFGEVEFSFVHYSFLSDILPFFSRLWFPYRMLAFTQIALSIGIVTYFTTQKKHLYLMGALVVVHLYQLYDYRMLPVVQSTVYAGGAYDSQDIEGAIVELPIGYAKPTITHQIYHKRPVFGGMGENISILQPVEHQLRLKQAPYRKLRTSKGIRELEAGDIQKIIDDGFSHILLDKSVLYGVCRHREGKYEAFVQSLVQKLGEPVFVDEILVLWRVKNTNRFDRLDDGAINTDIFDVQPIEPSSFEKRLQEKNRIPN